ncbi:TIGR04066 family peptide maturation system protein [Anaerophilus nitritogenes]|uniref:TIGR04066 family peptide maturation system protein n=1 Tax=Anaerophilus nitritogenes TaxID=2498136 RepID=UPI00101CF14A|nr:TIGR04066 family peptide maturation system protein [Anaerophilus nitritogenes]
MKIMIYPFDKTFLPVLQFLSQMPLGDEIVLISPRGWGLTGKEYSYGEKSYVVKSDFEKEVSKCSNIFIVNSRYPLDIKTNILPLMNNVYDKKIIISKKLSIDEKCEIRKNLNKCQILFADEANVNIPEELNEILFNFSMPVIFVAGITEETDKFKVQLELYSELCQQGYNVGMLTSRADSVLCDIPTLPDFLYDEQISIKKKIILLNQFIKKYELSTNPDILIIGIPGEVLMLSNYYIGHGGTIAHIISQAITADSVILCSMYSEIPSSSLINIGEKISEKLGSKVKYHAITNKVLDYENTEETKQVQYLTLPHEFVLKNSENYKKDNMYFTFLCKDIKRMTNAIIEDLSE